MLDRQRMISWLLQMAVELGWTPPGDVIDEIIAGGVLITTQAADVCEVTKSTIHRWLDDAAAKGRPLGVLTPAGYLIGRDRLLDYVEATQDRHVRGGEQGETSATIRMRLRGWGRTEGRA